MSNLFCPTHPTAHLVEDHRAGDVVCPECGLVVGDRLIDVGTEWRSFNNESSGNDPSRVGAPENPLLGSSDLSTTIQVGFGASDNDASLANAQRKNMSNSDRQITQAISVIREMSERIHLTKPIQDQAIFKDVLDSKALRGKNNEAQAAACHKEGVTSKGSAYQEYWEEEDQQDIIIDEPFCGLKKGGQIPLVLPETDAAQFSRLTIRREQKAAHEDSSSPNILFQLPPSLGDVVTCGAKHCLSGLPTGVEVGKLHILRSGRAVMDINGHLMDVSEAIPSQYFETLVRADATRNALHLLGSISHSFVCSKRSSEKRSDAPQNIILSQLFR